MKTNFIFIITLVLICGCSKMQDKKTTDDSKQTQQPPVTQNNSNEPQSPSGLTSDKPVQRDEKAEALSKEADDAIAKYTSDKSDANKKEVVAKCMTAANYVEFEAQLPAREKYRPALKYYRKVLELDPANKEAEKNKKEIEDIYTQMGMPIPQ